MIDFREKNRRPGRLGRRTVIVPLQAARAAWLVFDGDGEDTAPLGPIDVFAIAYDQSSTGDESAVVGLSAVYQLPPSANRDSDAMAHETDSATGEEPRLWFVLLPADCGEWESLFVEQKHVFFAEEDARSALEERRQRRARERR